MILDTGYTLPKNEFKKIQYGDILKSNITKDVIVMHNQTQNRVIVKVVDADVWFGLKEFLDKWGTELECDGNINYYVT